jgi:hypothetical protein
MAVSNSCGSQILNILIGLGLPWLITNAAGRHVVVDSHRELQAHAHMRKVAHAHMRKVGAAAAGAPCHHRPTLPTRPPQVMAYVQSANVCAYVCLTLLPTVPTWRPGDHSKARRRRCLPAAAASTASAPAQATLGRRKAIALLCIYVVAIATYAAHLLARRRRPSPPPRPAHRSRPGPATSQSCWAAVTGDVSLLFIWASLRHRSLRRAHVRRSCAAPSTTVCTTHEEKLPHSQLGALSAGALTSVHYARARRSVNSRTPRPTSVLVERPYKKACVCVCSMGFPLSHRLWILCLNSTLT